MVRQLDKIIVFLLSYLTYIQAKCFIQTAQRSPVLRQFGQSAKQAITRVSILTFDLFPWRQSRLKLAKTLQMGQTPWWVEWTHLDAFTQICRNKPEVPSFRLYWPANNSSNQTLHSTLCVHCLFVQSDMGHTMTCFLWHWQHHKLNHPCNSTLRTHQLAAMEQSGVWQDRPCMFHTIFFHFL